MLYLWRYYHIHFVCISSQNTHVYLYLPLYFRIHYIFNGRPSPLRVFFFYTSDVYRGRGSVGPSAVRPLMVLELREIENVLSVFWQHDEAMRGSRWYPHLGSLVKRWPQKSGQIPEAKPILVTGDGDLADAILVKPIKTSESLIS